VRDALAGAIAAGGDGRFAEPNQDCRLNQSTIFEARVQSAVVPRAGSGLTADGRHPRAGELTLRRIASVSTEDARLFIDGGDPRRELALPRP